MFHVLTPAMVSGMHVPVSRPAISQHLKVLGQAGLVDQFWDDALDAFAAYVRETEGEQ